ncbi:MAG TPA: agmatine deiminase family protein, partial [Candidatus Udaeobacter sp.]|nr:agmatine deiminase family protein [Candidatus Udaeobacter sp.]
MRPIPARSLASILALILLSSLPAFAERSVDGEEELLPIWETPAETALRQILPPPSLVTDPPPAAPIRNVAEYEPCTGVLIRYPLGIPYNLINEMAEDVTVHVIVDNANQQAALNNFTANGVNPAHVQWLIAPTNSIWTRDYGPWFVFDGNGNQVILDHHYNRPRPLDDVIPEFLGQQWGIPVVRHDLVHTGGNYMTNGLGGSYSSDLVWNENLGMSHPAIAQFMHDYYGVEIYNVVPDISPTGIHHIDTWGKLLDEETVLMKRVAPSHANYNQIEANATAIAALTNPYGRPYRVVRVDCPNLTTGNAASYTNSLILNNKVLVPNWGGTLAAADAAALQVYAENMPGYEVLGFNYGTNWITDDALHCRVMNVFDRYMLRVDHNPVQEGIAGAPMPISVYVDDRSNAGLDMSATALHWRVVGAPTYATVPLQAEPEPNWYVADIPAQSVGTEVEYYVSARDLTGRTAARPRPAPAAVYRFGFEAAAGVGEAGAASAVLSLAAPAPNPFNPATTLRFTLPETQPVRLSVMDVTGREVARLVDHTLPAGPQAVEWRG